MLLTSQTVGARETGPTMECRAATPGRLFAKRPLSAYLGKLGPKRGRLWVEKAEISKNPSFFLYKGGATLASSHFLSPLKYHGVKLLIFDNCRMVKSCIQG